MAVATAVLFVVSTDCAAEEWTQTLFTKRPAEADQRFVKVERKVESTETGLERWRRVTYSDTDQPFVARRHRAIV